MKARPKKRSRTRRGTGRGVPSEQMLDLMPVACIMLDAQFRISYWNDAAAATFGFTAAEALGRAPAELMIPPERHAFVAARFAALAAGDEAQNGINENVRKDGQRIVCEWHNRALRARGRFAGVFSVAVDVSSRVYAERELRRREEQFSRLIANMPEVAWTADATGAAQFMSDAIVKVFGYTPAEAYAGGRDLWVGSIHPDDVERVTKAYDLLFSDGQPFSIEYRVRHKDGRWVWWYDRAVRAYVRDGVWCADGLLSDITERKQGEQALRESEERYRHLFQASPRPMWVVDRGTLDFLAVNDAAVTHYGYAADEFLAMKLSDIRPEEDVPRLLASVRRMGEGQRDTGRWRHRRKNGELIEVETTAHTMRYGGRDALLVVVSDVTAQMVLEEQLRQSQKMEAIGQLTGGIAHDLNNVLTAVVAHADLAYAAVPEAAVELRDDLDQVRSAAHRGAEMIRKLLAFSRRERLALQPLRLERLVDDLAGTLRRMLPEHVGITTDPAGDVPPIEADAGAVQQIVLNLATNARDAMPDGGMLRIAVDTADLDEDHVAAHSWGEPGSYVRLTVSDTGTGMTPEVKARLFEPFFTTKPQGAGTGLGMAMVYGLVKQHRGYVFVYSEPGKGTAVRVYFPQAAGARVIAATHPVVSAAMGTETVLVVEDEEPIRRAARRVLERHGYTVIVAVDGVEALERIRAGTETIDAVISDAIMPRMGGAALYETLAAERPGMPFLLTSGYTGAEVSGQGGAINVPFLAKPWTVSELLARVRELLDG